MNFTAPTDGVFSSAYINRTNIEINLTSYALNTTNITIQLFNITNEVINETGTNLDNLFVNYTSLVESTYYFNATGYDNESVLSNSITVNITIDNTNPTINMSINSSENYTNYGIINVTSNDTNFANVTLFIYNSTGSLITSIANNTTQSFEFNITSLYDGMYYYNATTYDLAGNYNSTETRNITLDKTNPNITINSPSNAYFFNTSNISINVTINETYISNTTIELYNSSGVNINTTNYTTESEIIFNINLTEGNYNYTITTRDYAGNLNSSSRNFTIDTTNPQINYSITNDNSSIYVNRSYVVINVSGNDTHFNNITVRIYHSNGTRIYSSVGLTSIVEYQYNFSSDGTYYYNATIYDIARNINTTTTRNITIDTIKPGVTINSPANNYMFNTSNVTINLTISDNHLANTTIIIYNSTNNSINTTTYQTNTSIIFRSNLTNGTYNYNITTFDTAGNFNLTSRTFIVNITASNSSSGSGGSGGGGGGSGGGSSSSSSSATSSTTTPEYENEVKYSKFWFTLVKGTRTIEINKEDMPVSQVVIEITENQEEISQNLLITSTTESPSNEIDAKIYKYIIFDADINSENHGEITVKIKVENEWLENNNLSENNLTIYSESNGLWRTINTKLDNSSNNTNYTYYTISVDSYEMLAIGSPIIPKIVPVVKKIDETLSNNETGNNSNSITEEIQTEEVIIDSKSKNNILSKASEVISNSWSSSAEYINSIPKQTQILLAVLLTTTTMLIIISVAGTLIYKKINDRHENKIWLRKYTKHGSITSYEQEPPIQKATIKIINEQPPNPVAKETKIESSKENDNNEKILSTPQLTINKIDDLISEANHNLNNGKIEDAKKYYADAKSIYFNSNISYEYKAKVYDKMMKLHSKIYKK